MRNSGTDDPIIQEECYSHDSHIFIQVACVMTEEELVHRKEVNLAMACLVAFVALFLVNYIDYMQRCQENNYIYWDVKTLTSGDYTVEVDIGP